MMLGRVCKLVTVVVTVATDTLSEVITTLDTAGVGTGAGVIVDAAVVDDMDELVQVVLEDKLEVEDPAKST